MPSKSKDKGNRVERIIVEALKEAGWDATRAWGSNGRALGKHEEVDIAASVHGHEFDIQVKGRKTIAQHLIPPDACDMTIAKADRQEPLVIMRMNEFVSLVNELLEPDTDGY